MGKSTRSNHLRVLQSDKAEKVSAGNTWIKDAERKKQEVLMQCAEAPKVVSDQHEGVPDVIMESAQHAQETSNRSKSFRKKKHHKVTGANMKKARKITALSGKNQFHKKKRKGTK